MLAYIMSCLVEFALETNFQLCNMRTVQPRPLDPNKDLASYGYGSVAWKERMESWKTRQDKLQLVKSEGGGGGKGPYDDEDLPV